ncbi:MAG: proteasome accessory factor, partial [Acidimicrobiaceae bacterium]|nr:proteasome accessory factor [Acidimicrobiaceae bacterium]
LASQPFMIGEGSSERVLVLVDAVLADKVEGELGPASVVERRDDGSVVVDVEVTNRVGLRSWVLGMRDHALVLSPPSVRDDVVEWLRAMAGAGAGE